MENLFIENQFLRTFQGLSNDFDKLMVQSCHTFSINS